MSKVKSPSLAKIIFFSFFSKEYSFFFHFAREDPCIFRPSSSNDPPNQSRCKLGAKSVIIPFGIRATPSLVRRNKGGILNAAMLLGGVPTALTKSHGIILTALTDCPFRCHPFGVLPDSQRTEKRKSHTAKDSRESLEVLG